MAFKIKESPLPDRPDGITCTGKYWHSLGWDWTEFVRFDGNRAEYFYKKQRYGGGVWPTEFYKGPVVELGRHSGLKIRLGEHPNAGSTPARPTKKQSNARSYNDNWITSERKHGEKGTGRKGNHETNSVLDGGIKLSMGTGNVRLGRQSGSTKREAGPLRRESEKELEEKKSGLSSDDGAGTSNKDGWITSR